VIIRIWYDWTTRDNADAYEALLRQEITSDSDGDAVRAFAWPDLEASVIPDADRALLIRFDTTSRHYELLARNGDWKIHPRCAPTT
jgi:hypothetical protein